MVILATNVNSTVLFISMSPREINSACSSHRNVQHTYATAVHQSPSTFVYRIERTFVGKYICDVGIELGVHICMNRPRSS